jgi:hypothetical protein
MCSLSSARAHTHMHTCVCARRHTHTHTHTHTCTRTHTHLFWILKHVVNNFIAVLVSVQYIMHKVFCFYGSNYQVGSWCNISFSHPYLAIKNFKIRSLNYLMHDHVYNPIIKVRFLLALNKCYYFLWFVLNELNKIGVYQDRAEIGRISLKMWVLGGGGVGRGGERNQVPDLVQEEIVSRN